MSRERIKIVFQNEVVFDKNFNRIDRSLGDFRPIWRVVEKEFHRSEKEQFNSEGSLGASGKWKPLSKNYAKRKKKEVGNLPILQRSKKLFRAVTSRSTHTVVKIRKDSYIRGTNLKYPKYVNRERPIVSLSQKQIRRMQKKVREKVRRRALKRK